MLNIVIPMAGLGSRFARAGYAIPKPLIPIHGVPMIRLVIANVRPAAPHRFVFICQRSHVAAAGLEAKLDAWAPGCRLVQIDGLTEGAACTVLAARHLIDTDEPLMIANSDQYVETDIDGYLADLENRGLDGLVMTMDADDPKWSFAAVGPDGMVTRIAEKQAISRHATVGIYNFRRGADFVRGASAMLARNLRVNGEFYVAPVYNELIAGGARVGIRAAGRDGRGMHGLGVPDDLDAFLALPLARTAAGALA